MTTRLIRRQLQSGRRAHCHRLLADNTARIWDANTGQQVGEPLRHGVTRQQDGMGIVTASEDKTARIWNTKTGQQVGVTLRP